MSDYCTLTDVQGLIVNITLSSTSKVTDNQVINEIIPDYTRYLEDRLGKYYQVPITGTNALKTMNRIQKLLCAAEVMERVYIAQAPAESSQSTTWRTQAEHLLKMLEDGDIILVDAVSTGDTPEPISKQVSDNLSQPTYTGQPLFSTQKQF